MCGIAGWLSPRAAVQHDSLLAMRESMVHRGPDGSGLWISKGYRVGFAHRRLSIIDLSEAANQPMHDPHGRAVIVFNGEIYNHLELRTDLEQAGILFQTDHSDTETILAGYLHWGLDQLLDRLNGMFAFAIYDFSKNTVNLVRDRLGIKPLYLAKVGCDLLFASEIKAIIAQGSIRPALDQESFYHHLSFRACAAPQTLLQGVETLAAGELMVFDLERGTAQRRTWWDPLANSTSPPTSLSQAKQRLEDLLESAVAYRMIADVPIGLFLSGGVDSAYLLQLMADHAEQVRTYTIVYPGFDMYNEGNDAQRLAQKVRAVHHEVSATDALFRDALIPVVHHQDEPIAAPVCTSVYLLSQSVRETGTKVVLAGEGSDELFIGYHNWMRLRNLEQWNQRIPNLPGRLLRRGVAAMTEMALPWLSPEAEIARRAAAGVPLFWGGAMDFSRFAKQRLWGPSLSTPTFDTYAAVIEPIRSRFLQHRPESDVTAWMSYVDLQFRLPQLMLPRLDKMGMAHSVEGRVPFLDHRIVEFVMGLPPAWRAQRGKVTKPLFKAVAEGRLPSDFVHQTKRGFQSPVKEWKNSTFGKTYVPLLIEFARRTGLFDPKSLQQLLACSGDRLYFSLLNFMLWYLLYIENVLADKISFTSSLDRSQHSSRRQVA